ncbi:MAG: DUF418 domain-containing protein [Bryobacteraceae bacterium]
MKPVGAAERVGSLDTLRGLALGGVLLVNLLSSFRGPLSRHILGIDEPVGWGGAVLLTLVGAAVEFKAFTLFSFLFGVGVAVQSQRGAKSPRTPFLLRRFGALLIVGLFHLLFVWNGDILTLYGICGLLLLPMLKLSPAGMGLLGLFLIVAPHVIEIPVGFPDNATLRGLTAGALHAYRTTGWPELVAFRWRETKLLIFPLLALSLPRTLGLMLWGVAAWRRGLLEDHGRLWRWILSAGAAIGVVGLRLRYEEAAAISLAFAYAAALLLWNPHAPSIAAVGQMALSNYLLQSIVCGFAFYGYGLGLFGRVGIGLTLAGGIALYCTQCAASRWWLRRFYFGPFEWLWRSISYRRWQPFLREEARTISREKASPEL